MILILGRFQPLHNGHMKVIKDAYSKDKNVVIAIGSASKCHEPENPFTSDERLGMLKAAFEAENMDIRVVKVPNISSNKHYVRHVAEQVGELPTKVITENPWTKELFEKSGIEVIETARYYGISATKIRKMMIEGDSWKEYVPVPVVKLIEEIGGAERMRSFKAEGIQSKENC